MKQFTIRLDDETHKALKYLSIEINKSLNEYVIELIKKDLESRKKAKKK
jgi:predicted HicB family RNase H-like nuclease